MLLRHVPYKGALEFQLPATGDGRGWQWVPFDFKLVRTAGVAQILIARQVLQCLVCVQQQGSLHTAKARACAGSMSLSVLVSAHSLSVTGCTRIGSK